MDKDATPARGIKTLVIELWGMGDAVIMSSVLETLRPTGRRITVLCKPVTRELLQPTYPDVSFLTFRAPWTAFRGKYRMWRWPWLAMARLVVGLRRERFDEALSIRPDLRDHLLMFFSGARKRCGFSHNGVDCLLNACVPAPAKPRNKVEDWHALARSLSDVEGRRPRLILAAYPSSQARPLDDVSLPILVLHCGAGQHVRRWPSEHWAALVKQLRRDFRFHLALIPDGDGFGSDLAPLADSVLHDLSLAGLVQTLGRAALFLGNDSGPGHLAAAVGTPTISIFGPQRPELFTPYGPHNLAIARDLCSERPCSDYCRFPRPYCMVWLRPEQVAAEVSRHLHGLVASGVLPPFRARRPTRQPAVDGDVARPEMSLHA